MGIQDDLTVFFGGDISKLAEAAGAAKDAISEVGQSAEKSGHEAEGGFEGFIEKVKEGLENIEGLKKSLEGFTHLAEAAFAVHEIEEFAKSMGELGFETEKANAILGITNEEIATLSALAATSGSSLGAFESQFSRLFRSILDRSKNAESGLRTLGLSFADLSGKGTTEMLDILAEKFSELPAGVVRTTAAMELFGRAGTQMLPVLSQGKAGIEEMQAVAERTGTILSEDLKNSMVALDNQTAELGKAFTGLGEAIYGATQGSIAGFTQIMIDVVESLTSAVKESFILSNALWVLNGAIGGAEIVLVVVIGLFKELWNAGDAVVESLIIQFKSLAAETEEIFKPLTETIEAANALAQGDFKGALGHTQEAAKGIDTEKIKQAWKDAADQTSAVWRRFHDQETALNNEMAKEIDKIGGQQAKHTEAVKGTSEAALELKKRFDDVLESVTGAGGGLDKLIDKIETLKKGLGEMEGEAHAGFAASGNASELIKNFEGFREKAYYDVNHYRVGYGSDTKTDASGKVSEVTKDTTVTREDAERDLNRRTGEFAAKAAEAVGKSWDALSDHVKASLTSMTYNYGHLPADVAEAAKTGDPTKIASSIRAHERDNGGVNSKRRAEEAANAEAQDLTPKEADKAKTALGDLEDQKTKLDEKAAGGSDIEKAKLKAIEAQVAGKGDEIKAQEALVAATQHELDITHGKEARSNLEKQLGEEKLKLQKLHNDATEAGLKLDQQRAKTKGDPEGEHDAAVKSAELKMKEAAGKSGVDSAEYKQAQGEKEAADNTYYAEKNRLSKQSTDEEIKDIRATAEEKRKALDDELSHQRISASQWLAQSNALNSQEAADIRAKYDSEVNLANQTSEAKIAIKNKEKDALRQISNKMTDDERKAADISAKEWEASITSVTSTFTTALKGMITGHQTFQQSMTKAFGSMTDKMIDMIGKMLAKWIASELTKTATTTAGVAARTSAETAGSAGGIAVQAASMLKSIAGSAGQAFAGVFGFMAPILGPAAAGPAAAAEATVMATGAAAVSADIGMWQVPGDMNARIYRNELVMPAGEAGAFRSFLSTAANSKDPGRVNVNPAVHFHVAANDSQSVQQFFQSNHKTIMRSVDQAVRHGSALGLRTFTP